MENLILSPLKFTFARRIIMIWLIKITFRTEIDGMV